MMPALLLLALAQTYDPAQQGQAQHIRPRTFRSEGPARTSRLGQASYAFFEFAPADGVGMPAVCSTTAPTGAKGEVLTFTRATTATCTKTASGGLATTGIADGDLVSVASGVARVEYDSNGVKGLLVEEARTNSILRSEEFDNAAWTIEAGASVTANYGTAPDGTATADRLQSGATSGGGLARAVQNYSAVSSGSATTCSAYVRSNASGGTTDICLYDGAAWSCADCVFVAGSYSRCSKSVASGTGINRYCSIGNSSGINGGVARSAVDLLVWGAQGEAGASVTSYIPTTNAVVARNLDAADFMIGFSPASGVSIAANMNVATPSVMTAGGGTWLPGLSAGVAGAAFTSPYIWPYVSSTGGPIAADATGTSTAGLTGSSINPTSQYRGSLYFTSGAWTGCVGASCFTGAASVWSSPTYTRVKLSENSSAINSNRIISRVCADPSPTRCR